MIIRIWKFVKNLFVEPSFDFNLKPGVTYLLDYYPKPSRVKRRGQEGPKPINMEVVLAKTAPPMNAEPNPEAVEAFNRYEEQRLIDEKLREEEEYNNAMIRWCQ